MKQDTRKKLMEKTTGLLLYLGLPIVPQEQLNLLIINDNTSNQASGLQKSVYPKYIYSKQTSGY
ncbi:hypothetical protein D172_003220 [Pseudoalteromonas sp. Bsw20308]|nr:hypothetical protein D172_003220 [Pseudoalteromonas sp. Bsw20308]